MRRYFFDAIDGVKTIDVQGEELPDIEAARIVAGRVVSELISNRIEDICSGNPFKVVIRTDQGVIETLTLSASGKAS